MALSIGIVGLPNVGKSTVLNALAEAQLAVTANYPFCTIEPNRAVVPVPDPRLDRLAELVPHDSVTHATVEFVDIAGLVKGASHGEGLGNQFLGQIRNTDAIAHIVRCFDDENVVHVQATPEPRADMDVVNLELALADLEQLEKKIEGLRRQVKGDRTLEPTLRVAEELLALLDSGQPVSSYSGDDEHAFNALEREMRFLTAKPVIYVANVDEEGLQAGNDYVQEARAYAGERGAEFAVICAKLEEEMAGMDDEERHEYLALSGIAETGLELVIRKGYGLLGLISFFTTDSRLLRAWTVRNGWTAPDAAGVIHTDFERGFIRAEVIPFDRFDQLGSEQAAKSAGVMRVEGKEYVVQDGDVIHFRFNV
jgi:GTP-binding protein YchF